MTQQIHKIRAFRRLLRSLLLCLSVVLASSQVWADGKRNEQDIRNPLGINSSSQNPMANQAKRRISNRKAASLVKQKFNSSRVLGVSLIEKNGPPIYRVRTLSPDGVVKSVFVDGESGEVFE